MKTEILEPLHNLSLKEEYTDEHQDVWLKLNEQQKYINAHYSSEEYKKSFKALGLESKEIIMIDDLSQRLERLCGWRLLPVPGLVPTKDFFRMLTDSIYPVTVGVRGLHEMSYSETPDKFHDIYGHVPLLVNERFNQFLSEFCAIGLKYIDNDLAMKYLDNFYWYTFEMGLINENGKLKSYGGALLTSLSELKNVENPEVSICPFDVSAIFDVEKDISNLQTHYFCIQTYEELFDSINEIRFLLEERTAAEDVKTECHSNR